MRPQIGILESGEAEAIHAASVRILADPGVRIAHPQARRILALEGAVVAEDGDVVRLPASLVEEKLALCPTTFRFAGQAAGQDLECAYDGPMYARPAIGIDMLHDHVSGERRPATLEDVKRWTRVIQALEHTHIAAPVYPQDVPAEVRDVHAVAATLRYANKPLVICAYTAENVGWMAELVSVLPRGLQPRIGVVFSADSPLTFSANQVDIALAACGRGMPIFVNSAALLGATSPVTLWGCLVQMHAEALAAITLVQTAYPGTPVVYDMQPLVFDMKTGYAAFGYAELGLLNAAFIELGRSLGLITESSGVKTDSYLCDEQAGREKVMTGYASFFAGANFVSGVGSLGTASTASLAQLVLDDDILGQLGHLMKGDWGAADTGAEDAIRRVKPQGHYLADEHTLAHFRTQLFFSRTAVRGNFDSWLQAGAAESSDMAVERVEAILAGPDVEVLDPAVSDELSRLVRRAEVSLLSTPVSASRK